MTTVLRTDLRDIVRAVCVVFLSDCDLQSKNMNPKERASHPSRSQVDCLIEFLEKNPNLAKGFSKVPSARDASRKTWEGLAIKLNSLGGCVKTWKQWTKYWADKKSAVKKKAALRFRSRNKTGGGVEPVVELSEVEERILNVMGGESFSIGDRHLTINPFVEPPLLSQDTPCLLADCINIIPTPTIVQHQEPSTASLIFSDVPELDVPAAYTSQHEPYIQSSPGPSAASAVRMVTPSPREMVESPAHTPPRTFSPSQPATPSGSGNFPARRRLDVSRQRARHNTAPSVRQRSSRRRSPPSQRQSQFVSITERFLSLEEQRIEIDRRNSEVMEVFVNRQEERDRAAAQAQHAIAEALRMLAEALKNKEQ